MSPLTELRAIAGDGLTQTYGAPLAVPSSGFNFSGLNTDNVVCCSTAGFAPPARGAMKGTAVWCYMAGHTAPVVTRGGIWLGNGTLIGSCQPITVPRGTGAAGGQRWTRFPVDSPPVLNSGTVVFIGWWRQANQDHEWSVFGAGNFSFENLAAYGNIGIVTTCTGSGFQCGAAGIYLEYEVVAPRPGDSAE